MRLIILNTLILMTATQSLWGQLGGWKTHKAYHNTTKVENGDNRAYAIADGSLYSYTPEDESVTTYSHVQGLSDQVISNIAYHSGENVLLIIYSNGNIDLLYDDGSILNLPYLKDQTSIQDKTINSISIDGDFAYLAAAFGIVNINLKRQEIADTYRIDRAESEKTSTQQQPMDYSEETERTI